ncbi:MAG TPA: TIGR00730 family Rossman fold protein [Candidatus Paceibacterota bacterium]|nr:TIGR00730 family Rossman fold protein [Candidatus Paceibacterota bacterium]
MWKETEEEKDGHPFEPGKPVHFGKFERATRRRMSTITREIQAAFALLKCYPRSVTFFGSTREGETDVHYQHTRALAYRIVKELDYAIVTGGGPGIMEAANRGAFEAKGESVGMNLVIPTGQKINQFLTAHITFYFLFVRKLALTFAAQTYIFFPGGFGTLDELFEILTLIQTKKMPPVPIILCGKDYWDPFDAFIKTHLEEKFKTIDPKDRLIYHITDDDDEILSIIKKAPVRKE